MSLNIPGIRQYDGAIPDRARMDRQEFAEATYYYLRYLNSWFVPDIEAMRDALNTQLPTFLGDLESIKAATATLRDETQALRDETESFKNTTLTLKNNTQTLHDETQTFKNDAANSKTLAQRYANEDEDIEVEAGLYSAKHWMLKAQSLANDTSAVLPQGAINDTATSTTTTWSSQKLDTDLAKVDLSNVAASAILGKVKTVDGNGSGLDADFLDGREASSFADASHTHQISDVTGLQEALDSKADVTSTNSSLAAKEDKANKVTSWSSTPSDTNYPSELLVKSSLDAKADAANVYSKSTVDGMLTNKADKNLGNVAASDVLNKVKAVGGSGSGLDADLLDGMHAAQFTRAVASASANVGAGWITVAKNVSGRHYGRIIVTDQDSGDHAFIEIDWMRSYADSNFTVINVGGHGRRITGVRILEESGNVTYGTKLLQVYVTTQSTYTVTVITDHEHAGWSRHDVVTPVVQNSISGYAVKGYTVTRLDVANIATRSDIEVGGAVRTAGGLIVDGRWTVSADGNTLYEGGVALSSKYLGKTAKAADSAKLNGLGNSTSASANTIAQRDGAGDITARLFRTTYGAQTTPPPSTAEFFFRKSRTDNYMRPLSAQAFIQWLQDQGVGMAIKNTFWVDQLWVNNSETKVIDIGFSPSDWCKVYVSGGRYYGGPTGGGFLNNRLNPSNIAYSAVQLGSEYIWVFPYSANQVAIRNDSGGGRSFRLTVVEFS